MDRVGDKTQAGCAYQYDLENPVADVGNWEGFVIASLVATWLQSVAFEHGLFILIYGLPHDGHNQDTEDDHYCQQDPRKETDQQKGLIWSEV